MKQNHIIVDVDTLVDRVKARCLRSGDRRVIEESISVTLSEVSDQLWG